MKNESDFSDPAVFRRDCEARLLAAAKQIAKILASQVGDWECISKKIAAPLRRAQKSFPLKQ